jgi:hypothetical protein
MESSSNVIEHVSTEIVNKVQKKNKGQFYTVNVNYILEGFNPPTTNVIEPFAGKGDLLKWVESFNHAQKLAIEKYDIDPKCDDCMKRDTLLDPPNYTNKFVLTNPPYLARNKSSDKTIFNKYNTNDLYKCFLLSLCIDSLEDRCAGGIIIIPAGFFFSPRDIDVYCRNKFLSMYKLTKVKYFEESVFPDTPTTVVAIQFVRSERVLEEQEVLWNFLPADSNKLIKMTKANDWIIGGDIYKLPINHTLRISRYISGYNMKTGEQLTNMTLNALDSGKTDGKIGLTYKKNFVYQAKDSSRSYATLIIKGKILNDDEQVKVCSLFNTFLEEKRTTYNSLFLPQYRESKEYARKRIPFDLAYSIVNYILCYELE